MLEAMLMGGGGKRALNTWVQRANLPATGRYMHNGGTIDDKLYICGGRVAINPSVYRKDVWCYTPTTDSWAQMADMPVNRGKAAAAVINGKMYVYGGDTGSSSTVALNTLICYDPVTNAWTTMAPGPGARVGCMGAAVGTKMYVFGGSPGSGIIKDLWCYDTVANSWSQLASYVGANATGDMVAIDTKLYFYSIAGDTLTWACYDTLTDTWSRLADTPVAFTSEGMATVGGKIYVNHRTTNQTMYIYDPAIDSWSMVKGVTSPISRSDQILVTIKDTIYIQGGYDAGSQKYLQDLWQYFP